MKLHRTGILLIIPLLMVLSVGCGRSRVFPPSPCSSEPDADEILVRALNRFRMDHGLKEVKLDSALNRESIHRSSQLSREGKLSHFANGLGPLDRLESRGVSRDVVGEVIARSEDRKGYLEKMLYGWIQDRKEKEILLDPRYRRAGTGFSRGGNECFGVLLLTD